MNGKERRSSREHNENVVGILAIDYDYIPRAWRRTRVCTFGYTTRIATVRGLTFERAQRGEYDDTLRAAFVEAIAKLKERGPIVGISGDCGFHVVPESACAS